MSLKDELVLITGATSGFGEATARRLAKEGARLLLTGRRKDRLEKLQSELGKEKVKIAAFDIRDEPSMHKVLNSLQETPTVLINNAGLALGMEAAQKASIHDWHTMIDTNIKALVTLTHALLPDMIVNGKGYIINIGSMAGNYPYPGGNVYGASKAFVHHFSLGLRADVVGTPIRVTSVEPGLAETEFALVRMHGDAGRAKELYNGTKPLKGEDVAEAISWLLHLPAHVNINFIEMMPTCQAPGALQIARK